MMVIGLTGSIGMGKSAVAMMFARQGVPVFDADAEVHILQGPNGLLLAQIEAHFPGTTGPKGVDRTALGQAVFGDPTALKLLESIVHPALAKERKRFLRRHRAVPLVVLDIPLLFEKKGRVKKGSAKLDIIVVASASPWQQRKRVLARPGMTIKKFRHIRGLQTPDHIKRRLADVVVETGCTKQQTALQIRYLLTCLKAKLRR